MAHRSLVRACLVAATLAWSAVTANAATFTYDLTLTQSFGTPGLFGTGQFVVTGATNSGLFTAPGDLNSLEFNIDGHVFTLGQATGGSGQVVLDGIGHLTNIDYSAPAPISLWVVLQASGIVYNYKDVATNHFSYGLITAVLHAGDADARTGFHATSRRTPALRHRPRRVRSAWLAEEAESCRTSSLKEQMPRRWRRSSPQRINQVADYLEKIGLPNADCADGGSPNNLCVSVRVSAARRRSRSASRTSRSATLIRRPVSTYRPAPRWRVFCGCMSEFHHTFHTRPRRTPQQFLFSQVTGGPRRSTRCDPPSPGRGGHRGRASWR